MSQLGSCMNSILVLNLYQHFPSPYYPSEFLNHLNELHASKLPRLMQHMINMTYSCPTEFQDYFCAISAVASSQGSRTRISEKAIVTETLGFPSYVCDCGSNTNTQHEAVDINFDSSCRNLRKRILDFSVIISS